MLHGAGRFTYIETPKPWPSHVGKYSAIHGASGMTDQLIVYELLSPSFQISSDGIPCPTDFLASLSLRVGGPNADPTLQFLGACDLLKNAEDLCISYIHIVIYNYIYI